MHDKKYMFINFVVFLGLGGKSPVCLQEGGRGGEILRHHLQRPRGEFQWGHPISVEFWWQFGDGPSEN